MKDVWQLVHAERAALIDDLAGLTEDQWGAQSLCGEWTVREVAAHLVNNARTTRLGIVRDMVRARFDFDRMNAHGVAREARRRPHRDPRPTPRRRHPHHDPAGARRQPARGGGRARRGHPTPSSGSTASVSSRPTPTMPSATVPR